MKDKLLCCSQCGNIHVQVQAWVDINTNEYISDVITNGQFWCDECAEMVTVCTVEEYENKTKLNKQ